MFRDEINRVGKGDASVDALGKATKFVGKAGGPDGGVGTLEERINCFLLASCGVIDVIDNWYLIGVV